MSTRSTHRVTTMIDLMTKQIIRQMGLQALVRQNEDRNEVHKNGIRLPSATDVVKWGILNLSAPTRTRPALKLEAKIRQYQFHRFHHSAHGAAFVTAHMVLLSFLRSWCFSNHCSHGALFITAHMVLPLLQRTMSWCCSHHRAHGAALVVLSSH